MRSFCVILMGKDTRQLFVFFVLSLISVNRTNKVVTIDIFHFYCHFNYILCVWLEKKIVQPKMLILFQCVCVTNWMCLSHLHSFAFLVWWFVFFWKFKISVPDKWVSERLRRFTIIVHFNFYIHFDQPLSNSPNFEHDEQNQSKKETQTRQKRAKNQHNWLAWKKQKIYLVWFCLWTLWIAWWMCAIRKRNENTWKSFRRFHNKSHNG